MEGLPRRRESEHDTSIRPQFDFRRPVDVMADDAEYWDRLAPIIARLKALEGQQNTTESTPEV